jgi:hypothetical protein
MDTAKMLDAVCKELYRQETEMLHGTLPETWQQDYYRLDYSNSRRSTKQRLLRNAQHILALFSKDEGQKNTSPTLQNGMLTGDALWQSIVDFSKPNSKSFPSS